MKPLLIKKSIMPELDGFDVKGRLLFRTPVRYILRGFVFDPSAFSRSDGYINVFVRPLFVPDTGIAYVIGDRIGKIHDLNVEPDKKSCNRLALREMRRQGLPLLNRFERVRDIADHAVDYCQNKYDLYAPEMAAYAAILLDDTKTAEKMFDCAEKRIAMDDDRRDWVVALIDRIRTMRKTFQRDPQEAKSILHRWRDETAANLKLSEFIDDNAPA